MQLSQLGKFKWKSPSTAKQKRKQKTTTLLKATRQTSDHFGSQFAMQYFGPSPRATQYGLRVETSSCTNCS